VSERGAMLNGWEWDEALPEGLSGLHQGLVALLTFGPDRTAKLIGTGFIVGAYGSHAVAITAAHNFYEGVRRVQVPIPQHNVTALAEFLPGAEEIKLDRKNMRAIYQFGSRVEVCLLGFAAWDKTIDLAVFTLSAQNTSDETVFRCCYRLGHVRPAVGDLVYIAGYGDMDTLSDERHGEEQKVTLVRRLVLRAGRVKALHLDGHILCRGPCIETSIPVFAGMSGGPVFQNYGPGQDMIPFGLLSSDPDEPVALKNDRNRAGSSIVSLLSHEITNDTDEVRKVLFKLATVGVARNAEFDATKDDP
jgi:Trypsin-like peptidase domain